MALIILNLLIKKADLIRYFEDSSSLTQNQKDFPSSEKVVETPQQQQADAAKSEAEALAAIDRDTKNMDMQRQVHDLLTSTLVSSFKNLLLLFAGI
jgi:hypothetical protein